MVQYRIPNLLSHMQAYIKPNNPNHNLLAAEHLAWIDASLYFSEAHKKAWKQAEMPLFACRAFPESSLEALRVCLEYMIVSALLEQLTDAPASTPEAQKWADVFKQALKQTVTASDNPASETLKDFTYRVLNTIQEPHRSYLIESNILLAEGMVKEAAHRETPDEELTLETYMEARRRTIGIRPIFDIGRWIYDLDIAHYVLTHPEILKLEQHIYDLVFLANDLYSYKKEFFACGAHHNYVTIILSDPITGLDKYDRQGAINHTSQKFLEVLADLEHQRKTLPTFGGGEDAKVSMYVDMMMDVVVGNIQWSLTTARYGHFEIAGTAEAPIWGDVVFDMDPL